MHARLEFADFTQLAPAVTSSLRSLGKSAEDSGLEKGLIELIKLRASQINGCAFCLQFHLNLAREANLPQRKLDLLAAWRDAGVFTPREMAALAWTEALTHITPSGIPDDLYAHLHEEFSAAEVPFVTAAIVTINAWNRIAIAFRFTPPLPQTAQ